MLRRIANTNKPPLRLEELQELREQFLDPTSDRTELRTKLESMKIAFRERGDVKTWDYEMLNRIDECFVEHFMPSSQLSISAFVPGSVEGINKFIKYCDGVDEILWTNPK
jgi:hypothetical protein